MTARSDRSVVEAARDTLTDLSEPIEAAATDSAVNGDKETEETVDNADMNDEDDPHGSWNDTESPTSRTLHGVVHAADGPYACGEGGILLQRDEGEWRTLVERGPGVAENTLRSIGVTDDGCRLWFAGDSGALGAYDVADGRISDYSAPMEKTSTWEAIAVTGTYGTERLRVANGSGEVLDIVCEGGCPTWGDVVEPGGGSTIPALVSGPDGFYAVDTSGGAYYLADRGGENEGDETSDGTEGEAEASEWERIGIENAEVDFYDIWAGEERVFVAGSDGIAYRYDPDCDNWTPLHVGEGVLQAIGATGTTAVAVGDHIYERTESPAWDRLEVPTEQLLFDLALARTGEGVSTGLATISVDVAVGAAGTILERDREVRE